MTNSNPAKPDKTFQVQNVKASIWYNDGDPNISLVARYQNDGDWYNAEYFRLGEAMLAIHVMNLAVEWCKKQ